MRTFFTLLTLLVCLGSPAIAQQIVKFNVTDGVNNNNLKSQIEYNVTQFLTEVNRAGLAGRSLQFANVHITDNNNHPVSPSYRKYMRICRDLDPRLWKHSDHAPVIIGENCWIGRNVSIMKGVTIGDNSVIAANSVVTKSVPANCIAAGNPAKVVKTNIEEIPAPTSCEGYNKYINSLK